MRDAKYYFNKIKEQLRNKYPKRDDIYDFLNTIDSYYSTNTKTHLAQREAFKENIHQYKFRIECTQATKKVPRNRIPFYHKIACKVFRMPLPNKTVAEKKNNTFKIFINDEYLPFDQRDIYIIHGIYNLFFELLTLAHENQDEEQAYKLYKTLRVLKDNAIIQMRASLDNLYDQFKKYKYEYKII